MAWLATDRKMPATGSLDDKNQRRFSVPYQVIFDRVDHDAVDAMNAPGMPDMFSYYQGPAGQNIDTGAILVSKNPVQDENPFLWKVDVSYASITIITQMRLTWQQDRRPAFRDYNGRAVRNSAGSYFDPPIEREFSRAIIQISRAESSFDFFNRALYADAVNTDQWLFFPPGTVKIAAPPADSFYESGRWGWHVVWEMHYREEGWLYRALDAGYRQLDPVTGLEREIFDTTGHLSSSPVLLNGAGKLLRDAKTTLQNALNATDTLFEITDADFTKFPTPPYYIAIGDEVLQVTAHVVPGGGGNNFRVVRGQQGTVAAAHADAAAVTMEPYFLSFNLYKTVPFGPLNLP